MRINKSFVLGTAFGLLLATGSVYASTYFSAAQIKFTPADTNWNVTNADEAMNSLYSGKNLISDALIAKGVASSSTASFSELANSINNMSTNMLQFYGASSSYNSGNGYTYNNYDFINNGIKELSISGSYQLYASNDKNSWVGPTDGTTAVKYKYIRFTILSKNGSCGYINSVSYK